VKRIQAGGHLGQVDATVVPRFAGPDTFARLPRLDEVTDVDVAVLGVPFDAGVSYRPGARFGLPSPGFDEPNVERCSLRLCVHL